MIPPTLPQPPLQPQPAPPADLAAELRALLLSGYAVHIEPCFTSYGVIYCEARIERGMIPFEHGLVYPVVPPRSLTAEIKAVASGLLPTRPLVACFHIIFELGSLAAWLRAVRGVLVR